MFLKVGLVAAGSGLVFGTYNYFKQASKKLSPLQHVVIVGGGYGGVRLAKLLKGKGKFTLIDPKDALHHNMASLRAAVETGFSNKTFIPYKPIFGDNFVQGKVKDINIEEKFVILDNKEEIKFTELVLATGSSGPFPGKCDHSLGDSSQLQQLYEDYATKIKKAKKIAIIGGGAVGVELSGEIAGDFPDKEITIIHGSDKIVSPMLEQKARDEIMDKLQKKNINVLLNDKISNISELPLNQYLDEDLKIESSNGNIITADMIIPCYGSSVNAEAYSKPLSQFVNAKGQLEVNEYLQVGSYPHIFAIGDCSSIKAGKLALEAQMQGSKTFENLVHIGKEEALEPYKSDTFRMVVPIGRDGGVCQNGTRVMGDFMAKMIKAKDVFVKIMWKEMGQSVPGNTKN